VNAVGGADRFDVVSADGTPIAVWVEGEGVPLVLFHGAMSDHTTYRPLVSELRDGVATFAVDRRGRGASGDSPAYAIEREFDDVAAVVDAVAEQVGGRPVAMWGHSYGADVAMGGCALTDRASHLLLYEPGLGMSYPPGSVEKVEACLAAGDREGAIEAVLRDVVEMTDDEVAMLHASPAWALRVAAAHTVPRELSGESGWVYRPGQFDAIGAHALVLSGSESPAEQQEATRRAAAAIPNARVHVLEGHGHAAHQTDPAAVAAVVRDVLAS
jgi:pimeloyl-ACP methyl ester carboxylesterase